MKLFVSLLVVFCASAICNAKVRKTYGDITSYGFIGELKVFGKGEQNERFYRNVTFPNVNITLKYIITYTFIMRLTRFSLSKESSKKLLIYGIKHYDYEESAPSVKFKTPSGKFESGALVQFDIISAYDHGLSSIFFFYGIEV